MTTIPRRPDVAVLFSVNPDAIFLTSGPLGEIWSAPCRPGESYSRTEIKPLPQGEDRGYDVAMKRLATREQRIDPFAAAAALADMHASEGIFVSAFATPLPAEVTKARALFLEAMEEAYLDGWSIYNKTKDVRLLNDRHRRACRVLGRTKTTEWFAAPGEAEAEEKECPECAERVKARARVCRFCGYNFDPGALQGRAPGPPGRGASSTLVSGGSSTVRGDEEDPVEKDEAPAEVRTKKGVGPRREALRDDAAAR